MTESGYTIPLGRLIGVLIAVGGLYHALTPWVFGHAYETPAAISSVASGLTLLVFGGLRAAGVRGWPIWVCAAAGLWVLSAPQALGLGVHGLANNEALWGGLFVVVLSGLAALDQWFGGPTPVASAPY
ncbi:MAG TPA: SPW repeat protein [Fimbriiglobus sp.]|nr:SPW repeat protein [Fimbriiglobus sp.]